MNTPLAFIGMPGHIELIIIGVIAVLLFGHRLPKIARSVGSTIVEFKKGVSGIQEELNEVDSVVRGAHQDTRDAVDRLKRT